MIPIRTVVVLAMFACASKPAMAQALTRVSVDSSGNEGDGNSSVPALSADGRIAVFVSDSTNLVPSDTNDVSDVFVHDLATGVTERVSVDSSGAQGNDDSDQPAISSDGRYVAFQSLASNLVAGDTNATADIFLHDRQSGSTVRVSVDSTGAQSNSWCESPSISADGQVVSFWSSASNLVPGDTTGFGDVFVHDMATGTTEIVSVDSSGAQGNSTSFANGISGDGTIVVFESHATNLVAGDTNGARDVFIHDRSTGTTERMSVDSSGIQGNQESELGFISGDGNVVAFTSYATNLVPADSNLTLDVFVRDRVTGTTELADVDSAGNQGDNWSYGASLSSDGRLVAFGSASDNLVANDKNQQADTFVHDRTTGKTDLMTITDLGVQGDSSSAGGDISADGLTVGFWSAATNLVPNDGNGRADAFVRIPCGTIASWSNYGAGLPGTLGVPALTTPANPVLGTSVSIDVGNSSGLYSVALLFLGYQRADIPSAWGGDLLLIPSVTELLGLPPSGTSFGGSLPDRADLCGFIVDCQAIELDPGATRGVSFTTGLELILGR